MILKHFNEASSSILQLDGDEPSANRDVVQGITVGPNEKEAEHKDYLGGEYRTINIEKIMRIIKEYRRKNPIEKEVNEVTSAAVISSEKIKSILDLLITKDRLGKNAYFNLKGTPTNSNDAILNWLDTTKNSKR